jgi:hypothetical protein
MDPVVFPDLDADALSFTLFQLAEAIFGPIDITQLSDLDNLPKLHSWGGSSNRCSWLSSFFLSQ